MRQTFSMYLSLLQFLLDHSNISLLSFGAASPLQVGKNIPTWRGMKYYMKRKWLYSRPTAKAIEQAKDSYIMEG